MRDRVEIFRQISVNHVGVAPANQPVRFLDRIDRAAARAIAIGIVLEVRLEDRLKHDLGGSLGHPIPDRRDAERTFARFLKHWRLSGRGEVLRAHVVSYADDFVILSRGHAEEALTWTKAVMTKLGLTLNEAKTSVKDARRESFDFLGYTLGPRHVPNGGRWYLGASPSKKSVQRIKTKVSDLLTPGNKSVGRRCKLD
jgi:Reverse transcriptase (RNA-dependent DNA polymerase)